LEWAALERDPPLEWHRPPLSNRCRAAAARASAIAPDSGRGGEASQTFSHLLWQNPLRAGLGVKLLHHERSQSTGRTGLSDDQRCGCDARRTHGFLLPAIGGRFCSQTRRLQTVYCDALSTSRIGIAKVDIVRLIFNFGNYGGASRGFSGQTSGHKEICTGGRG